MKKRLDHLLVERGLAPSRSKAQQLIEAGEVEVYSKNSWSTVTQSSHQTEAVAEVRLKANSEILKYVSRGGLKLEGALRHLRLDVKGLRVLDLGVSTGGFADCLLKHGAKEILGVDVGHGQLDPRVKIQHFEGVNVKDIPNHAEIRAWLARGVDLCVADLSFISFLGLRPVLDEFLAPGTRILALIKPQFELGARALNKSGVVADSSLYAGLRTRALELFPGEYFPSDLKGQDGNQEFFLYSQI